ncbi:hypothetical protein Q3V37_12575 [Micromonospora profundi]|uniref:LPXTG cell wall anchor domain-containing protein n=1 Tax=Micromonospora profundi TaxID=1420889 RepID=A0AAJ6HXH8_9ACTN|nr:hypothetical protein [Micromonospora profundi]WLS47987.1 hypothetical protein Q3V37_12575 [Micromonospora profundi]
MAKKMLGKVVAGAALGGASLLVFAPGIAFADGHHDGGKDHDGKVYAKPHVVKAGDEVKLLEICPDRQEHAFVWSKVTGKVKLEAARDDKGKDHGEWNKEDGSYDREDRGRDEHGKDDKGKDEHGKDDKDKGKDHEGKGEDGKDKPQPPADSPQPGGQGGGAAADAYGDEGGKDWKGEEHGQDAENGRDKDWGSKDEGKKDWESKDEGKKDWESKDEGKKDWDSKDGEYGSDEYGSDKGWESKGGEYGSDEYGSDKGWDSKGGEYGSDEYGSDKGWDSKGGEYGDKGGEYGDHGKDGGWEREREFVYYGEAKVDKDAKPGRYELKGSCGEGELVVLPHGGVDGGDGGASTGTDRGLATGGASLLGAAALGGIVLMRRRRTDGSLV